MSDRDAFREAREHGLKARHETREARAVRKAVAEEIAAACLGQRIDYTDRPDDFTKGWNGCAVSLAELAREIGSRDPE